MEKKNADLYRCGCVLFVNSYRAGEKAGRISSGVNF